MHKTSHMWRNRRSRHQSIYIIWDQFKLASWEIKCFTTMFEFRSNFYITLITVNCALRKRMQIPLRLTSLCWCLVSILSLQKYLALICLLNHALLVEKKSDSMGRLIYISFRLLRVMGSHDWMKLRSLTTRACIWKALHFWNFNFSKTSLKYKMCNTQQLLLNLFI